MDIRVIVILILEAVFAYFLLIKAGALPSVKSIAAGALLLAAAFVLRMSVFDYVTADYQDFLSHWVQYFRIHGGFAALGDSVGNYNIPYLYFLALFSYSSINDLYLIKLLSVFFDVLLAWAVCRIVALFKENPLWRFCAFFAVLFWPTVFLNGALWGQCDSTYTAMSVLAIYLALSDRPYLSMAALAVSFGFKLQAVFIMPVFAVFLINGKLKLKHLFVFPLTYIILVLPAVIAGRPFIDTLTLYVSQTGSIGSGLNYNSPSLFAFYDHRQVSGVDRYSKMGIVAAFSYMFILLVYAVKHRKNSSAKMELILATLFALGIPLLLPHMHDRYFYSADIMTLTLAFIAPEMSLAAAGVEFASLLGYYAYLKLQYLLLMKYGAVINSISLMLIFVMLVINLRKSLHSRDSVQGTV